MKIKILQAISAILTLVATTVILFYVVVNGRNYRQLQKAGDNVQTLIIRIDLECTVISPQNLQKCAELANELALNREYRQNNIPTTVESIKLAKDWQTTRFVGVALMFMSLGWFVFAKLSHEDWYVAEALILLFTVLGLLVALLGSPFQILQWTAWLPA